MCVCVCGVACVEWNRGGVVGKLGSHVVILLQFRVTRVLTGTASFTASKYHHRRPAGYSSSFGCGVDVVLHCTLRPSARPPVLGPDSTTSLLTIEHSRTMGRAGHNKGQQEPSVSCAVGSNPTAH